MVSKRRRFILLVSGLESDTGARFAHAAHRRVFRDLPDRLARPLPLPNLSLPYSSNEYTQLLVDTGEKEKREWSGGIKRKGDGGIRRKYVRRKGKEDRKRKA